VVAVCGIAVALLLAAAGTIFAAIRRTVMFIWPALGVATVIASFVVAAVLWSDATLSPIR
jgi:hypothetical protein